MEFLIEPRFSALRGAFYFDVEELNAFTRAEYQDKFGFYQRTFGVYSYMRLTRDLKYRIHYPKGTPFMWQTHNSCAWTPTGTLSMDTKVIEPCRVKINEQFCYDEFMEGAYKAYLEWTNGVTADLSDAGVVAVNELSRTIVQNATLGARMTLSGGQLHDLATIEFEAGVETNIRQAFERTAGSCRGWIELCNVTSQEAGKDHLQNGLIVAGDISADGKTWNKDFVEFYDEMVDAAPTPLQDAIMEGGVGGFGDVYFPLMILGRAQYRGAYRAYLAQKETATVNEPRLRRESYQIETPRGQRTIYVLFIDETAIIPLHEIAVFDRYLTGTSHFAYLTISGVIQLGSSFAEIPVPGESEVGVMMQVSQDVTDLGTHKFLSHALLATALNDTDYISGDYAYATP